MRRKFTTDEWIERAKQVHGDTFDYSLVEYTGSMEKVLILCPLHGEFLQMANNHLQGNGCPDCAPKKASRRLRKTTAEFIQDAIAKHGDRYDYSLVNYTHSKVKVCIICPDHGEFLQMPNAHLVGYGCNSCARSGKTAAEFEEEAAKVHDGKYTYHNDYIGALEQVKITCPDHGDFTQGASHHLRGRGCPVCAASQPETAIFEWLKDNHITFDFQKTFETCCAPDTRRALYYDFFIPSIRTLIEYDGNFHFLPMPSHCDEQTFERQQYLDAFKDQWARENGLTLERIHFDENMWERLRQIFKDQLC